MTPAQLKHTVEYCIKLFDKVIERDDLPKPYPGTYKWANELGHEAIFDESIPVRIVKPLNNRISYMADWWKSHEGDVGIVVGRCQRPASLTLWMVQFPNGDIMPYPYLALIMDERIVIDGSYTVPSETPPENKPFTDPFEAGSKETYEK
jgi:hypothetical protein